MPHAPAGPLLEAARRLSRELSPLRFGAPVTHVYDPLDYAWRPYAAYVRRFGSGPRRVVMLGMNPGPFGMMQTGVPFGEVAAVRDWLRITTSIGKPRHEHPKRRVEGGACPRSEVSGRRLWGLFADRFKRAEDFFADHFVANYCPLAFLEAGGRNLTPDKLPSSEAAPLFAACDGHLRNVIKILQPLWLIGVGDFAAKRARLVFDNTPLKIAKILHPSPASPAANRDWAAQAARQLEAFGVW